MKKLFAILAVLVFFAGNTSGQTKKAPGATDTDYPRALTAADGRRLQATIDKEAAQLRQSLVKNNNDPLAIEITLDTFRVERYLAGAIALDYSTAGMRAAALDAAHRYDSLLNKYYRRLLQTLKPADRPALVAAQKAWITFRDAEMKLVGIISKEEYSGGGTVQQVISSDAYYQFVRDRALAIIGHLTRGLPG